MNKTILIADDSISLLNLLENFIAQKSDFKVVGKALNGQSALELTLSLKPDILLLDLSMPILDGIGVIEELTKHDAKVKVIIFSGHSKSIYESKVASPLLVRYIEKGSNLKELISILEEVYNEK